MNILVLGASKGTGALCVKSALSLGHSVTAFARTPAKLELTDPKLTKVAGNFHDATAVAAASAGARPQRRPGPGRGRAARPG